MQINQISQLIQPKTNQVKPAVDNSSENKAFDLMLQEMMQGTGSQDGTSALGLDSNNNMDISNLINGLNGTDSTSAVNATDKTGVQNKTVNGLDSLSLNPQKLAQMQEIMQMSSANSVMSNLSSDDSSGDDSDSSGGLDSIGNSNPMGGNDGMSQILQTVLQNQETSSPSTKNNNTISSQIQQLVANMKL